MNSPDQTSPDLLNQNAQNNILPFGVKLQLEAQEALVKDYLLSLRVNIKGLTYNLLYFNSTALQGRDKKIEGCEGLADTLSDIMADIKDGHGLGVVDKIAKLGNLLESISKQFTLNLSLIRLLQSFQIDEDKKNTISEYLFKIELILRNLEIAYKKFQKADNKR